MRTLYPNDDRKYAMQCSWASMLNRCRNPNHKKYKYYGGKGIVVCEKWRKLNGFCEDMQDTWFKGATIERLENDKGYYKENCKWIVGRYQRLTQSNVKLTQEKVDIIRASTKNMKELALEYGVAENTIYNILTFRRWKKRY